MFTRLGKFAWVMSIMGIVFALLPLSASAEEIRARWEVRWQESTGRQKDEYALGKQFKGFVPDASAAVELTPGQYVVGNAAGLSIFIGRTSEATKNTYSVEIIPKDDGTKFVALTPIIETIWFENTSTPLSWEKGFRKRFNTPPNSERKISLALPAEGKSLSIEAHYAAEFMRAGEHVFTVTVFKNGTAVKKDTIIIPVGQSSGKGAWRGKVEYRPVGASLLAGGASSASEAKAVLGFVRSAYVTFRASGDFTFSPAGTYPLPLDASPVWTRLVPATKMPVGEAEIVYTLEYTRRPPSGTRWGTALTGKLEPQVSVVNIPPAPVAPMVPTARISLLGIFGAGIAGLLGYFFTLARRRIVDVWLEKEGDNVWVCRGRRGPSKVRVLVEVTNSCGAQQEQELILGRHERVAVELKPDWVSIHLATPGRRNVGVASNIRRGA